MSDTLVFIPAWNEEDNLPAVLDGLRTELPEADVLVVDDGSTDRTADVAREHGAVVHSLGTNLGLRFGIAAGYRYALEHGYAYCGRVDADGQHPARELKRLLALVRRGACDVAVGSRFISGEGYPAYRYLPSPSRRFGTAVLRRAMRLVLGRTFGDATSGLYAVNALALPLLAETYTSRAPEVEALVRIAAAGLVLEEVPGLDGAARQRRVEAARLQGGQARADGRGHARRGEARQVPARSVTSTIASATIRA